MNRTERLEHLVGLTGKTFGEVRRNLPAITNQLRKKWNLNAKANFRRYIGSDELNMKAMELRLLLEYYYIDESSLLKINWRKFKKVVLQDFGREFVDCFNAPKLIRKHQLTDEMVDAVLSAGEDKFERGYDNNWLADSVVGKS